MEPTGKRDTHKPMDLIHPEDSLPVEWVILSRIKCNSQRLSRSKGRRNRSRHSQSSVNCFFHTVLMVKYFTVKITPSIAFCKPGMSFNNYKFGHKILNFVNFVSLIYIPITSWSKSGRPIN